jgi:hypothetical protein
LPLTATTTAYSSSSLSGILILFDVKEEDVLAIVLVLLPPCTLRLPMVGYVLYEDSCTMEFFNFAREKIEKKSCGNNTFITIENE